jgi:hypothetical protein
MFLFHQLNYICNRILITGVFLYRLRYAIIKPRLRKGNKEDISIYRPISILTSFSKIFAKVMQTRLLKHLTDHNIFSNEQFGFRKKLRTDNVTCQLTNEIVNALNNKSLIGDSFCELEKAVDCVNHKILTN